MRDEPVLECQTCGEVVKELSMAEAQAVSYRPYDFITYCREHKDDWKWEARKDGLM